MSAELRGQARNLVVVAARRVGAARHRGRPCGGRGLRGLHSLSTGHDVPRARIWARTGVQPFQPCPVGCPRCLRYRRSPGMSRATSPLRIRGFPLRRQHQPVAGVGVGRFAARAPARPGQPVPVHRLVARAPTPTRSFPSGRLRTSQRSILGRWARAASVHRRSVGAVIQFGHVRHRRRAGQPPVRIDHARGRALLAAQQQ